MVNQDAPSGTGLIRRMARASSKVEPRLRVWPRDRTTAGAGSSRCGNGNGVLPMNRGLRPSLWSPRAARALNSGRNRSAAATPAVESLEGRVLLSIYTGFTRARNIPTVSGIYNLQISGPGVLRTMAAGRGAIDLKVLGTTTNSTLTITQIKPRFHKVNELLAIRDLSIKSGQIGSIEATSVELVGTMTPLSTSVSTLAFGALGSNAQIDVAGSVSSMTVGDVDLGPNGHVMIAGDLNVSQSSSSSTTPETVGTMAIDTLTLDGG